ncbi:hypothetical protein [Mycolicibacterium sp. CBMA 226]|uniref:hypothetical protein n=1 Tax=Mycolicibacterium sp. CBMA 226 TaxID=2606611 RepID=UPI0012DED1AD|nr:hypothetical protein [Mycolicibacterium sp. CBMA 226]MUL78794.1 hypothetical protein [Mycolicibacterium sp. CBMA 226]QGW61087.1 hypothetical protein ICEMyc226_00055 [Mycolicibacterium sp.]
MANPSADRGGSPTRIIRRPLTPDDHIGTRPTTAALSRRVSGAATITGITALVLFGVLGCGASHAPASSSQSASANPTAASTPTAGAPAPPLQMELGRAAFTAPGGWVSNPAPPDMAAGTNASAMLAPAHSFGNNGNGRIDVLVYNLDEVPGHDQASLAKVGVGGPKTFGGRPIWGYTVQHTNSVEGPGSFNLKWNIVIDGPTRVDVGCDVPTTAVAAYTSAITTACEQLVRSLVIRPA